MRKSKQPAGWLRSEPGDAQLFKAYWDPIERGRGDDVFSGFLKAEGRLAKSVLAPADYQPASEWMDLEHQ